MKKSDLINDIHATQDTLALCRTATYSADWVIGLLSQIAAGVATLETDDNENNSNINHNDQRGI